MKRTLVPKIAFVAALLMGSLGRKGATNRWINFSVAVKQSRILIGVLLCAAGGASSAFQSIQQASQPASDPGRKSAISGVVTSGGSGRPIGGALVSLYAPTVKISVGTVTDSKGRFVFTDLPAAPDYTFTVRKSGYYNDGKGKWGPLSAPPNTMQLAEHEWRQNENLVLWPFGTISGRVVDEHGEAIIGVPVFVLARIAVGGSLR